MSDPYATSTKAGRDYMRLRMALERLVAELPEYNRCVSEHGCESWATDEYETAIRAAREALDTVGPGREEPDHQV